MANSNADCEAFSASTRIAQVVVNLPHVVFGRDKPLHKDKRDVAEKQQSKGNFTSHAILLDSILLHVAAVDNNMLLLHDVTPPNGRNTRT